jgi:uncharacterized peroxidase-related enzyme
MKMMRSAEAKTNETDAMALFDDLTELGAPPAAQAVLAKTRELFGFVPNLALAMAAEPAALESYLSSLQAIGRTTLAPLEQQLVMMAISRVNEAPYSIAVHATVAASLGADPAVVEAVARGTRLADPKLAALRRLAELLTAGRGQVSADEVRSFLAAGYDRAALVAVAFTVSVKTFANTMAHLAQPALDAAFAPAAARL